MDFSFRHILTKLMANILGNFEPPNQPRPAVVFKNRQKFSASESDYKLGALVTCSIWQELSLNFMINLAITGRSKWQILGKSIIYQNPLTGCPFNSSQNKNWPVWQVGILTQINFLLIPILIIVRNVSMLHQNEGGIGKPIPRASRIHSWQL